MTETAIIVIAFQVRALFARNVHTDNPAVARRRAVLPGGGHHYGVRRAAREDRFCGRVSTGVFSQTANGRKTGLKVVKSAKAAWYYTLRQVLTICV